MVCIQEIVLEDLKPYQEEFEPSKPLLRLTKKETLDYFSECKIPEVFASPWPERMSKKEYRIGIRGSLVYHGPVNVSDKDKRLNAVRIGGVKELDTYFNKVLINAFENGWINIYLEGNLEGNLNYDESKNLFSDIEAIQANHLFANNRKDLLERMQKINRFENQRDKSSNPLVFAKFEDSRYKLLRI